MTRLIALLWLATAAATAWGLFQVKAEVQRLEEDLEAVRKTTAVDREAIEILQAEWSFLNQPGYIADLAERHLGLAPIKPGQVVPLDSLAAHLDPQPDTAPDDGHLPPGAATLASAKTER